MREKSNRTLVARSGRQVETSDDPSILFENKKAPNVMSGA